MTSKHHLVNISDFGNEMVCSEIRVLGGHKSKRGSSLKNKEKKRKRKIKVSKNSQ